MKATITSLITCIVAFGAIAGIDNMPSTPEELGRRTADALRTANTNALRQYLAPYEAGQPLHGFVIGNDSDGETHLRQSYRHKMDRTASAASMFRQKFESGTSQSVDSITSVDVVRRNLGNDKYTDVILTFHTSNANFRVALNSCINYSNNWYLFTVNWPQKQDNE